MSALTCLAPHCNTGIHSLMTQFLPLRRLVQILFALLLAPMVQAATPALDQRDIVFYYGGRIPVDDLRHYDHIVIQPSQVLPAEREQLLKLDSLTFAYVSIGEVARNSEDLGKIKSKWSIGTNPLWNSLVMDMSAPAWRDYLLEQHFGRLWQQGYRAFFLDTVDSYLLAARDGKRRELQEDGLVTLLAEVKRRFPGVKLLLNRGFEVLDRVHRYADGMIAESLFHGFDPLSGKHAPTKPETRQWLINQLKRAQNEFNIPVTVLDYVEPGEWREAEQTAKQILELGFMPWVANGDLTWLGQGRLRLMPRRVLAIVDGTPEQQWDHPFFRHAAMPLEQLGLAVDYWYIDQMGLPIEPLVGRYSGVMTWLADDVDGRYGGVCSRLQPEVKAGLPLLVLGVLPSGTACKNLFNYQGDNRPLTQLLQLKRAHADLARPKSLPIVGSGTPDLRVAENEQAWLVLSGEDKEVHPVAVTAYGGYALHPHLIHQNASAIHQWLLDPLRFFSQALRLPEQPVLDLSTENGRRIGVFEVRADQLFRTEPGSELSAYDQLLTLLKKWPTPVTVGIIEAEIRDEAQKNKVQQLGALAHVRLASHTYSHPFYWPVFNGQRGAESALYQYAVPINGYAAELNRETTGTMAFLSSVAPSAPALLMWSGDGKVGPAALAAAQRLPLPHYGGGGLHWQTGALSLADLSPMLKPTTWGIQVLTPLVAEPLFAKLWYGDVLNFRKVLEWNQQLGGAQRWRASSVSINADALLRSGAEGVINDALKQQQQEGVLSLWLDEFVSRIQSFQSASIARDVDGVWQVYAGQLRTVRMPLSAAAPVITDQLIGYQQHHQQRYLHLAGSSALLRINATADVQPMIVEANAPVASWQVEGNLARVQFQARGELQLSIPTACRLSIDGDRLTGQNRSGATFVRVPSSSSAEELTIEC